MQLYFLSFLSSSLFFLEVVVNVFDYFWKPNSLFSKFCVNYLLMLYLVYCNNCVLNDVNGASWCTCSLVALRVSECVSGLRKLEKTLNFFRCIHVFDLVLKYGSDINEGNWLQLLFYFIVLVGIVVSVFGMSFFSCVSGFRLKFFSFCTLTETFAIGFQKWFDHEWIDFGFFLLENGFFCWLYICMDWNLRELLNCYTFLTTWDFFDV